MKNIISLYFICLVSVLLGCSKHHDTTPIYLNEHTVEVRLPILKDNGSVSSLFDSIRNPTILQLQLDRDDVISMIDELKVFDGKFYFKDKQQNSLFCCDSLGKKQFAIKRRGRGSGEYLDLTDFCIVKDTIYVLDRMSPKIICYSAVDGRFLRYQKIDTREDYYALEVANNKLWMLQPVYKFGVYNNTYPLVAVDSTGKTLLKKLVQNKKYVNRLSNHYMGGELYSHNNKINVRIPMHNAIYEILEDSVYMRYRFDFEDKDIDRFISDCDSDISDESFDQQRNEQGIISLYDKIVETDSHLITQLSYGDKLMMLVLDKTNLTYKLYQRRMNGLYLLMGADSHIYPIGNNQLATVISPYLFSPFPKEEIINNASENIKSIYNQLSKLNIKEDDNPLLMTFTLQ